ncbi:MAG: sigma-54-dependent Fis family transcriptional regulator, partial [Clostridia bacterium]|nr:sigma-54-dependent Fis family transcriptional regulator [Deltaproteobacteria bacterium]
FEINGIDSVIADSPDAALTTIATEPIGVVLQDMNFTQNEMSGDEGVSLFKRIHELHPDVPILLMTAWTSLETAVTLVKDGAADYIAKPWDDEKLLRTVKNLIAMRELKLENVRLRGEASRARDQFAAKYDLRGLVYSSQSMQELVQLAVNIAPSEASVLITGANGSGKEKIAEIVQANSRRRDKPFVKVNAGGLPDELLDAELFGAEPGAYTGATKLRLGRFEAADGGTLFLDEIGNLSMSGQAKILRILQTGEFERLGSSATRKVNVRMISATNVDLPAAIADGKFREDLFFRLNVIELPVPALAERPDDIIGLANHFLEVYAETDDVPRLSEEAMRMMRRYGWPGNVRELQNRMQRAMLVCRGGLIRPEDLGITDQRFDLRSDLHSSPHSSPHSHPRSYEQSPQTLTRPTAIPPHVVPRTAAPAATGELERTDIEEALLRSGGLVSRAAAELGLSRQALYRRMEKLGIVLERKPRM